MYIKEVLVATLNEMYGVSKWVMYNDELPKDTDMDVFNTIYTQKEFLYTKAQKKEELTREKQRYIERPITINNKTFFASLDAYTKYKVAYDLGVKKGLTEGEVILLVDDKPKWQVVTKEEMEQYFEAFEYQGWKGGRKLGYYLEALESASTKDEVEAIVWEDERGV